jgi:hypothetical protein
MPVPHQLDLCVLGKCSESLQYSLVIADTGRHQRAWLPATRGRVLVVCSAARCNGRVARVDIRGHSPARMDTCWQVRCGLAPS